MEFLNNKLSNKTVRKAERSLTKIKKKYGDDKEPVQLGIEKDEYMKEFNLKKIKPSDKAFRKQDLSKAIALGNIKMGFGHYRIALAFASWIKHYGYDPMWLDLLDSGDSASSKFVHYNEKLYAKGSRWSAKSKLFNKYIWETMTYTGFRKLDFAYTNYRNAEIFGNYMSNVPREVPIITTHGWVAQGASYHFDNVYQAIPDNFALGLYLAPGINSFTQTPSLYTNYLSLRDFGKEARNFMNEEEITYAGHFIDREFVANIEEDTKARIRRHKNGESKRMLFTIGGSGAQAEYLKPFISSMMEDVKNGKTTILMNVGTHKKVIDVLNTIPEFKARAKVFSNNYEEQKKFAEEISKKDELKGIYVFHNDETMPAVYITNLLMRPADVLVTKPSELAFYPVPKMHIKHVGKHEVHGGLHAEEIGDAIFETETQEAMLRVYKMIKETDVTVVLNEEIVKNKKAGKYDGAKNIVERIIKENF